jgi:uncharacterized coiled-coil protein SlyX
VSTELEKRIRKFEKALAEHGRKLSNLSAQLYGHHKPRLAQHERRLTALADQLAVLHTEFGEFRRTQHSLVEAIGRVLDRQTHDSGMLELVAKRSERMAEQLQALAGRLAEHFGNTAKAKAKAKAVAP